MRGGVENGYANDTIETLDGKDLQFQLLSLPKLRTKLVLLISVSTPLS